jgi:hypothetical protein
VHFIVLDGRYKGVGRNDGSRLMIDGRATAPSNGISKDHWNDLVAQLPSDQDPVGSGNVVHLAPSRNSELKCRAG